MFAHGRPLDMPWPTILADLLTLLAVHLLGYYGGNNALVPATGPL